MCRELIGKKSDIERKVGLSSFESKIKKYKNELQEIYKMKDEIETQ